MGGSSSYGDILRGNSGHTSPIKGVVTRAESQVGDNNGTGGTGNPAQLSGLDKGDSEPTAKAQVRRSGRCLPKTEKIPRYEVSSSRISQYIQYMQ